MAGGSRAPAFVSVRRARPSDRPDLVRMRKALWPDSEDRQVDVLLTRPAESGAILVAGGDGGGLVGFAEVGLRPFADGCSTSPVAYLEGIWVDYDARRGGVASALVEEAARWALGAGLTELASDCELGNDVSASFHRAAGFAEVQRSICFRRALTDGVGDDRRARAGSVVIEAVDPSTPDARWCLDRYFEELAQRFEGGFDPAESIVVDHSDLIPPHGVFLVARLADRPVACGAVKRSSPDVGYIKRMWVDTSVRGLGLGRRLLAALERAAHDLGCTVAQLETNRALTEAIRLYGTAGYREVAPFNDEPYAHHWFEKRLE